MSAKALGAMVKGMGESCFEDLLPWLMETLTYEQSSVDRSGAAQGETRADPGASLGIPFSRLQIQWVHSVLLLQGWLRSWLAWG